MKLPKLFGKKKAPTGDEEDEDELDREEPAAPPGGTPAADGEDEAFDDEDGETPAVRRVPRRKILFIAAGGGAAVVILLISGAWWLLSGGPAPEAKTADVPPGTVVLDIPPRPNESPGQMTPQPGQKLSATDTLNAIAAVTEGPGAGVVITPVRLAAFSAITAPPASQPLSKAPDPGLVEQGPQGSLPTTGADGRKPWQVYARAFPADDKRPRIAVIVGGLGLSRDATEGAVRHLPGAVTLAFDPYGSGLHDWVARARQAGHEVLLGLPMESADFPIRDAGPQALATSLSPTEDGQRLEFLLSRMSGYVGVVTVMGSRFTLDDERMRWLLDILNRRGLLYVDSGATQNTVGPSIAKQIGVPYALAGGVIDETPSRTAIGRRLAEIEDLARKAGSAVAIAAPHPVTVERLVAWAGTLEGRGIALAPVSAVVQRPAKP